MKRSYEEAGLGQTEPTRSTLDHRSVSSLKEKFERLTSLLQEFGGLLNQQGQRSIGQVLDELRHSAKACENDVRTLRDLHTSIEELPKRPEEEQESFEKVYQHRRLVLIKHKVIATDHDPWCDLQEDAFVPGANYLELGFKENFPTLYRFLHASGELQKVGTSRKKLMMELMQQTVAYARESEKIVKHSVLVQQVRTLKTRIAACDQEMRNFALRLQDLISEPKHEADETAASTVAVNHVLLFAKNLQMMGAARSANLEPPLILPPRPELQAVAHSLLRKSEDELKLPESGATEGEEPQNKPKAVRDAGEAEVILSDSEDSEDDAASDDPFGDI